MIINDFNFPKEMPVIEEKCLTEEVKEEIKSGMIL